MTTYTEFYCDYANGNNINAGDNAANGVVSSTGGAFATNIFTALSGTPFSGVAVGDFCALSANGATVASYIARVTAVGGGGATLTLSSTAKAGVSPGSTNITATTGGVMKGPNAAVSWPLSATTLGAITNVAGDAVRINLKNNASYAITSQISLAAAGPITVEGYTTTAGDGGKAVIDGGGDGSAPNTLLVVSGGSITTRNIIGTGNNSGATSQPAFQFSSVGKQLIEGCVVHDVRGEGFYSLIGENVFIGCEAYRCNQSNTATCAGFTTSGTATNAAFIRCISHDNSGSNAEGFRVAGSTTFIDCIADTNGHIGFDCIGNLPNSFFNCVAYGNASSGIVMGNSQTNQYIFENCIISDNGATGITSSGAGGRIGSMRNCAFYNNTTAPSSNLKSIAESGTITLSAPPFVAPTTGDFNLNTTAGGGASCQNLGIGTFTQTQASYTGTTSTPSVGAAEVAAASSSGGAYTFIG